MGFEIKQKISINFSSELKGYVSQLFLRINEDKYQLLRNRSKMVDRNGQFQDLNFFDWTVGTLL